MTYLEFKDIIGKYENINHDTLVKLGPNDPVKQYLTEIGRYPLLTPEEEKDLFTKLVIVRELADEETYRDSLERLNELGFDNNIVVSSQEDKMKYQIVYASEHTLEEIGELYNLTRERIRQIESEIKKKLVKKP